MRRFLSALIAVGILVTNVGTAVAAPVKISGNAIYSWWTHPIATQVGSDMYFSGIHSSGEWRVFKNNATESWESLGIDGGGDDHNAPALLVKAGKPTIAFMVRHASQQYISYRKAPEGTFNFGTRQYINFPNNVSYVNAFTYGDRIVLFTRSGHAGSWRYVISEDYGETWGTPQDFYLTVSGRVYLNFKRSETDSDIVHFAAAYNPDNTNPHYISYGRLNLATGNVSNGSTVIANIYDKTGVLPFKKLNVSDLEVIQNDDQKVRLLDVGDKYGQPLVYYAKWGEGITSKYYQAVQNTDGTWTRTSLGVNTGAEIGPPHPRHYIGGVALNQNGGNSLYVSAEASGTWTVKKYPLTASFTLGSPTTIATSSSYPLVRPYPVRGADKVIYQELRTYNTYRDYLAYLYVSAD